jgi:osmotically-inducible protein OsmY
MTQTPHRPDHQLRTDVNEELAWTPSVNAEEIGVAVTDGEATLSGHVGTYPEKEEALRAATRVHGVTVTADKIAVRHGHDVPDDADLTREAMIIFDRRSVVVPKNSVQVEVRDHVLTLRGAVPWQFQREAARNAVAGLPGISGVRNLISLRPSATAAPAEMQAKITAALTRHMPDLSQHVEVGVDGTQVTLTGDVPTAAERRSAEQTAWFAPGVTAVDNRMTITD